MSDLPSIVASYGLVLGGLAAYVLSVARRTRAAQRVAGAVERESDGRAEADRHEPGPVSPQPVETGQ